MPEATITIIAVQVHAINGNGHFDKARPPFGVTGNL